jgi:putative acetyltransferase
VRQLCTPDYLPEYIEAWVGKLTPAIYEQVIADWSETMFVAEKAGAIVGCSALSGHEVRAVYVNPLHARQGIGTLLMHVLEKEAFARSIPKLRLTASLNAELFYRKHGYQVVERSWYTLPCGTKIPCIYMEKYLR